MRYKVFYGPGKDTYAVCYGATKDEAKYHFGEYNPHTVILRNPISACLTWLTKQIRRRLSGISSTLSKTPAWHTALPVISTGTGLAEMTKMTSSYRTGMLQLL